MALSNKGAAIFGGSVLSIVWLLIVVAILAWCSAVLIPYTVESWAGWLGHAVKIAWWQGLIVGLIAGMVTRTGIVYLSIVCALITWAFEICGFTGF